MKLKLFFFLFLIFCISAQAQSYIFGKVTSEDGAEMQDVTVINIRTDEMTMSNRDGHFMISGRAGDELRFVKAGYDRLMKKVTPENVQSPLNITLVRGTIQIPEVAVKQGITGNLKIDSKNFGPSRKVEKLTKEIDRYIAQKTDPRVLAARPGEFVQPKGQGFSQIDHFIYYVFAGGFERKKILKYGFCSDADLNRFQRFVLTRISSYRAPQTQR